MDSFMVEEIKELDDFEDEDLVEGIERRLKSTIAILDRILKKNKQRFEEFYRKEPLYRKNRCYGNNRNSKKYNIII
jgi:hypothetical protein